MVQWKIKVKNYSFIDKINIQIYKACIVNMYKKM